LPARAFAARATRDGVVLALQTRMLYRGRTIFINGEFCDAGAPAARLLSRLADHRSLPPGTPIARESAQRLYEWYHAGYLRLGDG
jgi:50S ribosomal protein L16 3-hydroxylase